MSKYSQQKYLHTTKYPDSHHKFYLLSFSIINHLAFDIKNIQNPEVFKNRNKDG